MLYATCNKTLHATGSHKYHSRTASFSAFPTWIRSLTHPPCLSGAQGKHRKQPGSRDQIQSWCPPWMSNSESSGHLLLSEGADCHWAHCTLMGFGGLSRAPSHTREMHCWHTLNRNSFHVPLAMGARGEANKRHCYCTCV